MLSQSIPTPAPESFAALFEESLTRQEMRSGEVITAEVISVDQNVVIVNAGLKSESAISTEEFKNDRGELEVKPGDFVSVAIEALEDGFGATKLSREKAKKLAAWSELDAALEGGKIITGVVSGKVKGGLTVMVNGIRAFLPGSLVDLRPMKDTSHVRGQGTRIQGHQARPQAQQRRGLAPRRHGGDRRRRAPAASRDAEGRRDREGYRQEHHRLRRVRGPGRHRWPAAHHRPRLAPREAPDGSPGGRRRSHRQDPQVRRREEPRVAGPEAAGRGPVDGHLPPLPAGHAPLRQGHQHHRLRRVRRDRERHRGPGARLRDGLDEQERPPGQGRVASATKSR